MCSLSLVSRIVPVVGDDKPVALRFLITQLLSVEMDFVIFGRTKVLMTCTGGQILRKILIIELYIKPFVVKSVSGIGGTVDSLEYMKYMSGIWG